MCEFIIVYLKPNYDDSSLVPTPSLSISSLPVEMEEHPFAVLMTFTLPRVLVYVDPKIQYGWPIALRDTGKKSSL